MPTSKARKCRLIVKQKSKEKKALRTKTRLGLISLQTRSLQKNSGISKVITAIADCMKKAANFEKAGDAADRVPLEEANNEAAIQEWKTLSLTNSYCTNRPNSVAQRQTSQGQNEINSQNHPVSSQHETFRLRPKQSIVDLPITNGNMQEIDAKKDCTSTSHFSKISRLVDILQATMLPWSLAKRLIQRIKSLSFGVTATAINAKEIDDLKERIATAEKEIQMLKDRITNKCESCTLKASESTQKDNIIQLMPPLAPPLPPPPPPPPPPQLPALKSNCHGNKAKATKHQTKLKEGNVGAVNNMQITKDQILKVKLKRVSFESIQTTKDKTDPRIITLEDLRNVKLRKRPLGKENVTPLRDISNNGFDDIEKRLSLSVEKRTPLSRYNLRKTLKKVDMIRSPGGTPLVKSIIESGQGVTPLLTGALRKKFKNVNPPSKEDSPVNF